MTKPKPKSPAVTSYQPLHLQNTKPLIQLALNTYHENLVLIADLAHQILENTKAKTVEQPYNIRTLAERIVYFANDLTRDFNNSVEDKK